MSISCVPACLDSFAAHQRANGYRIRQQSKVVQQPNVFARHVPKLVKVRIRWSRFSSSCSAADKPTSVAEVCYFARKQLNAITHQGRRDDNINLAKACLLIALEEQAAADQELLSNSSRTAPWPELVTAVAPASAVQDCEAFPREIGSASTWSLARLFALADEVRSHFVQQHAQAIHVTPTSANPCPPAPVSSSTAIKKASNPQVRSSSIPGDAIRSQPSYGGDPISTAMHQYPTQAIEALNTILFERHGYHRMLLHGNPRDAQLHSVLDYGSGTPVALAILYMEVALRAGYPMVGCPLEGDKQFMVWPQADGLKVNGADFVIDPYSQGALYLTAEVAEMFDLDLKLASGLQPASKREILSALLASLRDAHWAQALGCSPEPGFMIPISLGTAASGAVSPLHGYHIERAVAAAERRSALLHSCRHVQLEYALLLYFASQHDAAVRQLLTYKEDYFDEPGRLLEDKRTDDVSQQEHEQLSILITRSKLHCANMAL